LHICSLSFSSLVACNCTDEAVPKDYSKLMALYPKEGWDVTDVALTFSWYRPNESAEEGDSWTTEQFRIQVSASDDFSEPIWDEEVYAVGHDMSGYDPEDEFLTETLSHWRQAMWMPSDLHEEGQYHWRIRANDSPHGDDLQPG
jgi:hypothetical protein